jgi:chemotaxis protein CheX
MTTTTQTGTPQHIQAILNGASHTFGSLLEEAEIHPPTLVPARAMAAEEVNVLVGFTDDLQGQILIGFPRSVALALSTHMMGGMEVSTFDELGQSILAEIGNMTAGSCATELHKLGLKANITCPTVIIGQQLQLGWPQLYILRATIQLPFGSAILAIGLKVANKPT